VAGAVPEAGLLVAVVGDGVIGAVHATGVVDSGVSDGVVRVVLFLGGRPCFALFGLMSSSEVLITCKLERYR
jgi:hypothetical protein